jgi:glycosyltransferase involved in cell wall biosynthesis
MVTSNPTDKTMRALITASTFPLRPDDGLPRFVFDLAEHLTAHCQVMVLAPGAPGALAKERWGEVDIRRFTYFWPRRWQALAYGHGIADNLKASHRAKLQPLPYILAQTLGIRRLVRRHDIDVVNSNWLLPQGLSAALARGPKARFRHVVTLHGGDAYLLNKLPFGRALARFVLSRTDHVFAVSSNVRQQLDKALGYPSGATLRPVGVKVERFRAGQAAASPYKDGYLLFVGRMIKIKGVDLLLEAMARVHQEHPGIGLLLVGYGPEEENLQRQCRALGLDRVVRFTGRLPHGEIIPLLRGCRAAVLPSIVDADGRAEGMPTVVLEALAAGTRLVASAAGGVPDVLRHGENGWLFTPGQAEDLAAKLRLALADSAPSTVLAKAEESALEHDWSQVAKQYAEAFAGGGDPLDGRRGEGA